jgi:hypothetical protein
MSAKTFQILVGLIGLGFTLIFFIVVVPPLLANPDIIGGFAAGFVNPYSSGYSSDVIACWFILAVWIIYEAKSQSIKYGWICIVLGAVPGVAVGLALYLIIRHRQLAE